MTDEAPMVAEVEALIARKPGSGFTESLPKTTREWINEAAAAIAAQAQRIAKQDEFKSYTHQRLDELGVPHTVPSQHTDAGCRVGGRFDWVAQRIAELELCIPTTTTSGAIGAVAALERENRALARAEKAEAALAQAVPREPTEAMIQAVAHIWPRYATVKSWQAMYDAAPAAPREPT